MAQTSVTNFFASRKRGADIHASKRRKVQRLTQDVETENVSVSEQANAELQSSRPAGKGDLKVPELQKNEVGEDSSTATKPSTRKSAPRATKTRKASISTRSSQRSKTKAAASAGQKDITQFLSSILESDDQTKDVLPEPEPTAAIDDHSSSPPCTPTKRESAEVPEKQGQKRSRPSIRKDLFSVKTPDAYDFKQYAEKPEEKDRLVMKGRRLSEEGTSSANLGILPEANEKTVRIKGKEAVKEKSKSKEKEIVKESKSKSKSKDSVKEGKISTKKTTKSAEVSESSSASAEKEVTKSKRQSKKVDLADKMESIRELMSTKDVPAPSNNIMDQLNEKVSAVKQKGSLSKKLPGNKLEELKQKLMQHNKQKKEVEVIKESRKGKELSMPKAPAYERFHNLAQPLPPSLTLPFKFKALLEKFQNTDTIMGMLHKRNELCTFSKLKAAVQNLSKRAFEESMLAQIKTVYPNAYVFRQEKGIPVFGKGRTSNYQLTVEANLTDDMKGYLCKSKADEVDANGKPFLSATRMLERRSVFHRNLLEIVKKHHKEFLNNLPKPLSIPDDKLTRWHPAFKVDEVPDVPLSDLPAPPDVKKFSSASEVLQHAAINNNRMKAALEKVAEEANLKNIEKGSPKSPAQNLPVSSSPVKSNTQLSGVSMSLLERIRAKEAKKMEANLTRTPAEEKRLQMMSRLPDIIRIVRTVFVTNKKPALPLDEAIARIMDSYRSSIGTAEAEKHVRLMVELIPDWISIVKIKAGEYIKIDKNKELTGVVNKVNKILQEAK
uniref:Cdt1 n=1 Tax=Platynereis dumerilii TaxID=6359 RepID=A0A2H5AAF8_PLADU|nr:Cdt1 [Platynereis dumerilii]